MVGDSRRESRAPVAIERLSELIPEIDSDFAAVAALVNACMDGEHSDLSRLEAFDADFHAQQLYDHIALAKGYFEQLGIGPDVEVLLRMAEKLRDDVHEYGAELVRLADAAKGDAAAEADVLQVSGELHDRAIVLNLDLLRVEAAYGTVKDLFARCEGAPGFANGIGQIVEELRARLLNPDISDAIAEADRGMYRPGEAVAGTGTMSGNDVMRPPRTKRSTVPGEVGDKIVAALTAWHEYENGSCLKYDPLGVRQLERDYDIPKGSASRFFKRQFGGWAKYRAACVNRQSLRDKLQILNDEVPAAALEIRDDYTPDRLPARRRFKPIDDD